MDNRDPEKPPQEPQTAGQPPEESARSPEASPSPAALRSPKKKIVLFLAALYLISLAAAAVVVWRAPRRRLSSSGPDLLALSRRPSVGWVEIHGPIFESESGRPWAQGAEQWVREIRDMADTPGVKALVLDINSPGGSVGAVQELHSQIERVRREKHIPVVAMFGDVAASGGYYIASACDRIVAHPGTLTGSIGVIFPISNLQGLFKKIGYASTPIKSGKYKDMGSPAKPLTPGEKKILQRLVQDAYGQFLAAVSAGRGIPISVLKPIADGRVYSGDQALKLKLVDELGDSTDAIDLAAKLAGIKGKPLVRRQSSHLSDIMSLLQSRAAGVLPEALLSRLEPPHEGLEYMWPGW